MKKNKKNPFHAYIPINSITAEVEASNRIYLILISYTVGTLNQFQSKIQNHINLIKKEEKKWMEISFPLTSQSYFL